MQSINNLLDLLVYCIRNLYLAEEQVGKFIPSLIEKAHHSSLKNALNHHVGLTNQQKERLTKVGTLIKEKIPEVSFSQINEKNDTATSKAIIGLIDEIDHLLKLNLSKEVMDAAIIASVQKIEHYEISSYGTAVSYAKQLQLHQIETLLNETLQEEYDADDLLTALANAAINKESVPDGLKTGEDITDEKNIGAIEDDQDVEHATFSISERTINSPGGRAGTSHRRYGNGESRGH
jgi:ferritin-like metal-binding protein YciE